MKLSNRFKRRWGSRLIAAMLAMILCMAACLTVMAGDGGTANNPASAKFTKYLEYADVTDLSHPGVKFTFTFTPISKDNVSTPEVTRSMPVISNAYIEFTGRETATTNHINGMKQVSGVSDNVVDSSKVTPAWSATGVYVYEVSETATGFSGTEAESMHYSKAKYNLTVVVSYASGQYYIEETYIYQTTTDKNASGGGKGGTSPGDEGYNFTFTNTYSKQGGSPAGTEALKITNTTSGTGSDPTLQFKFTIKADDSITGTSTRGDYIGNITRINGSHATETLLNLKADGSSHDFTLASGESIVFEALPAGTTFTVIETGVTGYLPTFGGTTAEGIISSPAPAAAAGADLSTEAKTIGVSSNTVNYINTYDTSIITGVLSNVLPFAALIAIAILAFIVFAAINRRKVNR